MSKRVLFGLTFLVSAAISTPSFSLTLEPVIVQGLTSPVAVTTAPGQVNNLYIVEQAGTIRVLQREGLRKSPFLDISQRVISGGELGLLGLAFHPQYASNGRFFVNYTTGRGSRIYTVVSEFNQAGAETVLLKQRQPYQNHNGGGLAFGPDGYLYISFGDGGSAGDPLGSGQDTNTILGSVLRIDVNRGQPYAIPSDNPFRAGGGRPEIYAYGLRNVWGFSWDPFTGLMYAADVGQDRFEEVNILIKGGNYGWNIREARHCFRPKTDCEKKGLIDPIWEYPRTDGISITGGYVYAGQKIPSLRGVYLFGDWGSGTVWGLKFDPQQKKVVNHSEILKSSMRISAFAKDGRGELLIVDQRGQIYRLAP